MATISIEDVESVDGARFSLSMARRGARRAPFAPTRREFVSGAVGVGAIVSMGVFGLFPTAKPARAEHGSWSIWSGCSGLGSWVNDDDCRGCNQGSTLCCCFDGYHRADGCRYMHRPDQCKSGGYDGWTWAASNCCFRSDSNCGPGCARGYQNTRWRCSDGYTRSDCANPWTKSICRTRVASGSTCSPCAC
jgi:hypothetical protein